jgi:hypothetical protein
MTDTRDMANYKPYRTKAQKKIARETARLCKDGTWRSDAPVSYHTRSTKMFKKERNMTAR